MARPPRSHRVPRPVRIPLSRRLPRGQRSRRFVPDFDPAFGDRALSDALDDIVIGRWQGVRDLLGGSSGDWARRTHRIRVLAHAAAGSSATRMWQAAEPDSPDAAVLRAATEVVGVFHRAVASGRRAGDAQHAQGEAGRAVVDRSQVGRDRLDAVVRTCLEAAGSHPADPMPWVSLLTVARLYEDGVPRRELRRWWDELRRRDLHNVEGHIQLLRYHAARWHGTHGRMYDVARDVAGASPPGSPLPVLVQIARAEEYRYVSESARGRVVRGFDQHWKHELAVTEIRRTWERWILRREDGPVPPHEVAELNYLAHAACHAGLELEARGLFVLLGNRVAHLPWAYTGEPAAQFSAWRERLGVRGPE
ncbi:hypothetical protein [Streptomyces sp. NPDC090029]|uniref:hypothetical protein n=1 Tax=Streptomyces sp. NPDC090029 TaxID=3365924 RepID=UPI0037F67C18